MKTKQTKTLIVSLMLVFALCMSALIVSVLPQNKAMAETNVERVLYYVEAGNLVANADGTGAQVNRDGSQGYPNKQATAYMTKNNLSFSGENALFNSSTDKVYGVDDVSGKSWGYTTEYTYHDYWRFGSFTANAGTGLYSSYRYINENAGEGTLTYKFEVENATTQLQIDVGSMYPSGWNAPAAYTLSINGEVAGSITATTTGSDYTFTANGVQEGDKYFITMTFGDNNSNAFVSYIKIAEVVSMPLFVVQGEEVYATACGVKTKFELNQESVTAINDASILDYVEVTGKINGKDYTTSVNVLPRQTLYVLDAGHTSAISDAESTVVKADVAYSADIGYGYVGTDNKPEWVDDTYYNWSLRIGDADALTYKFDIPNGNYKIVMGSIDPWLDAGRNMSVKFNDSQEYEFNVTSMGNPTQQEYSIEVVGGAGLTITTKGLESANPIVTYIVVAKDYAVSSYVQKGGELTGKDLDGNDVTYTLTQEDADKISAAQTMEEVYINPMHDGYKVGVRNVAVLPTNLEYFVDAGLTETRESLVLVDNAYDASAGYGYDTTNASTIQWENNKHHGWSVRVSNNESDLLTYKFDVPVGEYAVVIGSINYWTRTHTYWENGVQVNETVNDRTMEVKLNGVKVGSVLSKLNVPTNNKFYTEVSDGNGITVDMLGVESTDVSLSYIIVYAVDTVNYVVNGQTVKTQFVDSDEASTYKLANEHFKDNFAFIGWKKDSVLYNCGAQVAVDSLGTYEAVYAEFKTVQGGFLRLGDPYGLRFEAKIDKDTLDGIESLGASYTFGAKITTKADINSDYSSSVLNVTGEKSKLVKGMGESLYSFYTAITQIKSNNYNRIYYSTPYITISYQDGSTRTVEVRKDEQDGRSYAYIIKQVYDDVKTTAEGAYINEVQNVMGEAVYTKISVSAFAIVKELYQTVNASEAQDLSAFKFVESSASALGTSHNNISFAQNFTYTFRTYFKVREYGAFNYSFYYDNKLDTTWWSVTEATANRNGAPFEILEAYFADGGTAVDGAIVDGSAVQIMFNGEGYKSVASGEEFTSDKINFNVPEGHYLAFTWTIRVGDLGANAPSVPFTESTFASCFKKNGQVSAQVSNEGFNANDANFPSQVLIAPNKIIYDDVRTEDSKSLAFIGDSITQGVSTELDQNLFWVSQVAQGLPTDYSVWNLGSGWATAGNMASDGAWLKKAATADEVFICIGVNDLGGRITLDEYKDLINSIITAIRVKNADCIITLFTVPPFNYDYFKCNNWYELNDWIRKQEVEGVDRYFDFAAVLSQDAPNSYKVKEDHMAPNNDAHPNGAIAGTALANAFLDWYAQYSNVL